MLNRTWGVTLFAAVVYHAGAATAPPATDVPFELRDGLIWLQVQLRESPRPLNFLLDSGAGVSVINLPTLQSIGRLRGRRISVRGVSSTTIGYWPQRLSATEGAFPLPRD